MPLTGGNTQEYNYANATSLLDAQIADADARIAQAKADGDKALLDKKTAQKAKMELPVPGVHAEQQSAKAEKVEEDADPEEVPETKVDKPVVGERKLGSGDRKETAKDSRSTKK